MDNMDNKEARSPHDPLLGQIFKNFRKHKGFTQQKAAGTIVSMSQISNFEAGKSTPILENFIALLHNINVSLSEFESAYNHALSSKDLLLYDTKVTQALINGSTTQIYTIIKQIENEIKASPVRLKYRLDKVAAEAGLASLDPSYQIPAHDIELLKDYLAHTTEWGLYDIRLLKRCFHLLGVIKLSKIVQSLLNPTQANYKLSFLQSDIIHTLFDIIHYYFDKNLLQDADELISYLEKIEINEHLMFEKLTLVYVRAELSYRGGRTVALETMKQCESALELSGCFNTARVAEQEILAYEKETK